MPNSCPILRALASLMASHGQPFPLHERKPPSQRLSGCLPSWSCEFDSRHPLHSKMPGQRHIGVSSNKGDDSTSEISGWSCGSISFQAWMTNVLVTPISRGPGPLLRRGPNPGLGPLLGHYRFAADFESTLGGPPKQSCTRRSNRLIHGGIESTELTRLIRYERGRGSESEPVAAMLAYAQRVDREFPVDSLQNHQREALVDSLPCWCCEHRYEVENVQGAPDQCACPS